jgi:hypothetical protein
MWKCLPKVLEEAIQGEEETMDEIEARINLSVLGLGLAIVLLTTTGENIILLTFLHGERIT